MKQVIIKDGDAKKYANNVGVGRDDTMEMKLNTLYFSPKTVCVVFVRWGEGIGS